MKASRSPRDLFAGLAAFVASGAAAVAGFLCLGDAAAHIIGKLLGAVLLSFFSL